MIAAAGIGLICAVIASIPQILQDRLSLTEPLLILAIGLVATLVQRVYFTRNPLGSKVYDGVVDLLIHIHARYVQDSPIRWVWRSIVSFFLLLTGNFVGVEGAAAELSHSVALKTRNRAERWSEQRRRTDVAVVLAGAISAAFQSPFASVVLCLELGVGGRTLNAVISSVSAFAGTSFISRKFGFESSWVPFFKAAPQGEFVWWLFPVIGLGVGLVGAGLIRFFHYYHESMIDLFKSKIWLRPLAGGALLLLIHFLYPASQEAPAVEFMSLLSTPRDWSQLLVYFLSEVLILATVLSAFGTVGIFGPLFTLGGVAGLIFLKGTTGLFAGAAAAWAAVIGTPIAGAILIFEMTQSWKLLLAALIAAFAADFVRKSLKQLPMVHRNLQHRGLKLLDGRNAKILETILVRDAMVTDHVVVYEDELVRDLMDKFVASKHTFLPVTNRSNKYVGLLTLDIIQEGLESVNKAKGDFYEVKDLLYKTHIKPRTVESEDSLACTAGLFGGNECVAVTDPNGIVVGLLFSYSVRAAYDREVARRALVRSTEGVVL